MHKVIMAVIIAAAVIAAIVTVQMYLTLERTTVLEQQPTVNSQPVENPELRKLEYQTRKIMLDNVTITVEIADDAEKIERGLMYREGLPEGQGMLFAFEREHNYQFWMMNMKINLDMIWLNTDGKVVHIVENAEPCIDALHTSMCTYNPDEPALYVLEVNSGFVKKYGITEDSVMRILS
jgi:hypothetical protein